MGKVECGMRNAECGKREYRISKERRKYRARDHKSQVIFYAGGAVKGLLKTNEIKLRSGATSLFDVQSVRFSAFGA
jgi:hypothetical protein